MREVTTGRVPGEVAVISAASARQLRREAAKARTLADNAFAEDERRRLQEIASSLDREAMEIEAAIRRQVIPAIRGGRAARRYSIE